MPNFRTFIYSHNVFQGFTRNIDLDYVESIDENIRGSLVLIPKIND